MKNKRGLSDVISTVLIVLLALAAIAIVWGFIQPTLQSGGTAISYRQKCIDAEVKVTACNSATNNVTVQYVKGEVSRIIAVVQKNDGATITANSSAGGLLSTQQLSLSPGVIVSGDRAQAAAMVLDEDNKLRLCDFTSAAAICS